MDSEIYMLQFDINDDPLNQKVDQVTDKISTLKDSASQITLGDAAALPGYNDAFMSKLDDWTRELTNIDRTRRSMEHSSSSHEREQQVATYQRKVEMANNSIRDLANSQNIAQQLMTTLGAEMSQVFTHGLEGIVSQLATGIRATAMTVAGNVSKKLSDGEIVDKYMSSAPYQNIMKKVSHQGHPEVFSTQNMRQYLLSTLPFNVPQWRREAVAGGSQVQFMQQPSSFREMLPQSFGQIPAYRNTRETRTLGSTQSGNEKLSRKEIEGLDRLVRNNRQAADAAVAAGIMTKSGKNLYFNHDSTRDMVNAMGGFIMDDIVTAAGGEKKFGIDNVEAARHWRSISKKRGNNKELDGGLQAAHAMQDVFGRWLDPGSYSGITPFDVASGRGEYVGQISHSPRKMRRSFAEYTLDMLQNGAQISGEAPIVRTKNGWQTINGVSVKSTAEEVQKASGGIYTKRVTPDDYHTISLNDSLLQQMIMSTPSASKVGHNEFSDNTFYLKYDDKLGDPTLSSTERQRYIQEYGKLFKEGYNVNGEHYINTRVGKTHAEFMKASIVDDLGRQALGLAYDTPTNDKIRNAGMAILSNGVYGVDENGKFTGVTHFDKFKPFAKSMYNMNNMATEGESLATWKGVQFGFTPNAETAERMATASNENAQRRVMEDYGTPNMKVVVGSFGSADMDGSNWIVDTVSNEGFQGRTFGGKATYVPINMTDFRARNYKQVQGNEETAKRIAALNEETSAKLAKINNGQANEEWRKARIAEINAEQQQKEAAIMAQYGGDLIIPQAGIGGGDLVVPKDTQVIEDINNIKHYKTSLQDKTQKEMNELRSRDYSRHGIFAKTTYDDANTSSRWLSKQVINSSMNAGFRDPRVQAYFDKVFFDEISRMDNDQYVRDLLFQGDQSVNLDSEEAQQKISNHIAGMWAQYSEGDRLLPTGVLKYSMAAPNPQSVINNRLKAAGIALTPEQQALELSDNQVISMESLNKQLGIIRFPATKSGNVTVDNKAAISAEQLIKEGKATEAQIENLARTSGIIDRKGLYFAPNSPILKLLQGEDFDGDLNGTFGLSDNMNPKEAKEFSEVMRIIANASDREVEEIYGAKPGTPEFEAAWKRQEERKARQTEESKPKKGGYDLNDPYDRAAFLVNTPREHAMMGSAERSADMAALYYGGLNNQGLRGTLAQAIKDYESQYDVVSTNMKTDETWRKTREQATAADLGLSFSRMFKYANEAVETFGENDNSHQEWTGKSQAYLRDKNIDALGLPSIFQGGLMGTLMGRMKARQQGIDPENGVYNWADILNGADGKSGLALPEGIAEDSAQGKFIRMMRGVRSDFLNSKYLLTSNETVSALQTQYDAAREEIDNLGLSNEDKRKRLLAIGGRGFENFIQFGATQANMNAPWLRAAVQNLANQMGVQPEELIGHASFAQPAYNMVASQQAQNASQTIRTAEQQTPQIQQSTTPQQAQQQNVAEPTAIKENAEQEAKRLLHTAINNGPRENILLADENREVLLDAIKTGNIKKLASIKGIGPATAQNAIDALKDSRIANIKTTSAEEMAQPVAAVPIPTDIIEENIEQTQQITKEALEAQRQKVSNRILNTSYDPFTHLKTLQGELAGVMGETEEHFNSRKDINPNIKGRSRDEYIQSLKDEISEMKIYSDMWSAYQKQTSASSPQTGSPPNSPPNNPPSSPPGGNPPNTPWVPQANPYAQQNASMDMQAAQAAYTQLWDKATEFSKNLWGEALSYQQKNEGTPASIIKADKLNGIAAAYERDIRTFMASQDYDLLDDRQKSNLERLISPDQGLYARAGKDFSQISEYTSSHLVDALNDANSKASGSYDSQIEALEKWDKKIQEVQADQQRLLEMSQDPKYSKELQNQFKESANKIGADLGQINNARQNLGTNIRESNEKAFDKQIESLENKRNGGNKIQKQSRQYQEQIDNIRDRLTKKHDSKMISDEAFNSDMARLAALEKQTSTVSLTMDQNFQRLGRSINMVMSRFGRQLYQKALTEAKKFVQEFDKTMTSIQMITLKTDGQMSTLGDNLIDKAKELKISVSDVATSAETLYRQGLSDEEVSQRLNVISKFSKVSGTKVDAATKLITVAMNTGLVTDPQVAADIVTALGDNAATNASEIEKGIEKAGAAAAADGTTFAQLASMLTAITSTTQIGGNVAGRTLNTIFGRMNKIGTNELIYDENGNAVSGSAVAKLLEKQGIKMYDEKGNKRSSYDTLYALSQRWDKMSDAEQQQIANAIAGTRQYSNFAAIMQGMSEGKVDEYMALTGESEGIVDKKFDIYTKSLQASLTNLKNSFDELVNDLTDTGALTGLIDTFAGIIKGVDNLTNSFGGLGAMLVTVLPMLIGITAIKGGLMSGNFALMGVGAAALLGGGLAAGLNGIGQENASERINKINETYTEAYEEQNKNVTRFKDLKANNYRTEDENNEYFELTKKLAVQYGLIDSDAASAVSSLDGLSAAIQKLGNTSENVEETIDKEADKRNLNLWDQNLEAVLPNLATQLKQDLSNADKERASSIVNLSNPLFTRLGMWHYDEAQGKYVLNENAADRQNSIISYSKTNDSMFGVQGWINKNIFKQDAYSYDKDISPVLPKLYSRAAFGGAFDNSKTGYVAPRDEYYWRNKLAQYQVTDKEMQLLVDYYNQSNAENGYDFKEDVNDVIRKNFINEFTNSAKLNEYYSEGEIDYLAGLATDYYKSNGYDIAATLDYILAPSKRGEERQKHIHNLLAGYRSKEGNILGDYNIQDVGENGYYIGEDNQKYSREQVEQAYKDFESQTAKSVADIAYEYDQRIIAENEQNKEAVNAENNRRLLEEAKRLYRIDDSYLSHAEEKGYIGSTPEAERRYYEELWIKQKVAGGMSPELAAANWQMLDENDKDRNISLLKTDANVTRFWQLSKKEQAKYYEAYGDLWDTLSVDEQSKWIEKAKENIQLDKLPELDVSKLSAGVQMTAEELVKFIEDGNDLVEGAKEAIANASNTLNEAPNFEAIDNPFVDAIERANQGEKSFSSKNKAAISADRFVSLLLSEQFGEGAEGLNALSNYIRENSSAENDWNNIIESNTEVQRLMEHAKFDRTTHRYEEAPDDIMTLLQYAIMNGSLTYGSAPLTTQQKAQYAQEAFLGLTDAKNPWYISTQTREAAQDEAWIKYQEEVLNPYNNAVAELEADINMPKVLKDTNKKRLAVQHGIYATTKEEFLSVRPELTAAAMDQYDQQYLKEVLGDQLYSKVLESRNNGNKPLTQDEKELAQLLISNRSAGLTSLTSTQQLNWLNANQENLSSLGKENGLSRVVADMYMSQWSGWQEYAALIEAQNTNNQEAFESLGGTDRLNALIENLENYKEQSQLKLKIEGIQQLEDANKVLEGTTKLIENLQKGGDIAIKASLEFESTLFDNKQQEALLANGSFAEQLDVISAVTGLSNKQIQNMGFDRAKELTEDIFEERQIKTAEFLNQLALQGETERADRWAEAYGFENTGKGMTIEESLKDIESIAGGKYEYDKDENKLYWIGQTTGDRYEEQSQALIDRFFNNIGNYQPKTDENGNPVYENLAYSKERQRTSSQIAANRKQLLNGELTYVTPGRYAEYQEAFNSLGQYGQEYAAIDAEYQRMLRAEEGEYTTAEILDKYNERQEARRKALAENEQSAREAAKTEMQYALQQEGYANAGTIASNWDILQNGSYAERYGVTSQFEQQRNEARNAQYFLTNRTAESAGVLASFLGIDERKARTASNEELQEAINSKVKQMLVEQAKAYGADLTGFKVETASLADVKAKLQEAAAKLGDEAGEAVEDVANQISDMGNIAGENIKLSFSDYYNQAVSKFAETQTDESVYRSLSSMTITPQTTKVYDDQGNWVANRSETYNEAFRRTADELGINWENFGGSEIISALLSSGASSEIMNRILAAGAASNTSAMNAALGQAVLGDWVMENGKLRKPQNETERTELKNRIEEIEAAKDGTTQLFDQWKGQLSGWDTIDKILKNTTESYKDLGKAIDNTNEATDEAANTTNKLGNASQKALEKNSKYISDLNKLSNQTARYNTALEKLNKTENQAKKGKDILTKEEKAAISERTSFDANALDQLGADMLKSIVSGAQNAKDEEIDMLANDIMRDFSNQLNDKLSGMSQDERVQLDKKIDVAIDAEGNIDIASIIAICDQLGLDIEAAFKAWDGAGGTLKAEIVEGAESVEWLMKYISNGKGFKGSSGSGVPRKSGGGGGGGKSAIDELLEKQKQKIAEYEHRSKLLQAYEKTLDFNNDYGGWNSNISSQIAAQQSLRDAYASNLSELKAQLSTVEAGSDDYNKLADAIRSTEEAMAEISNTINELNRKRLTLILEKHTHEDEPLTHEGNMLAKRSTRFKTLEEFDRYRTTSLQEIALARTQYEQNQQQLNDLQNLLNTLEEGTDLWYDTRNEMWKIIEENEDLDLQAINKLIELQDEELAQTAKLLQRQNSAAMHGNSMYDSYMGIAQRNEEWDVLRSYAGGKISNIDTIISNNLAANEKDLELLSTISFDMAEQRQKVIDTIRGRLEENAQLTAEQQNMWSEINASYMNEFTTSVEDATKALDTMSSLSQTFANIEKDNKEWDEYRQSLKNVTKSNTILANQYITAAAKMQPLIDYYRSVGDKENERKAIEQRDNYLSQSLSATQSQNQARREAAMSYIEEVDYQKERELMAPTYMESMIKPWMNRYKSTGLEREYRAAVEAQVKTQQETLEIIKRARDKLNSQMQNIEIGTPEYEEAAKKLNEMDIAVENARVQLEELSDSIANSALKEILDDYTRAARNDEAELKNAGEAASFYKGYNDYERYREALGTEIESKTSLMMLNEDNIAKLREFIDNPAYYGSKERENAQLELQKALLNEESYKRSIYSLQTERANSYGSELMYNYNKDIAQTNANLSLAQTDLENARKNGTEADVTASAERYNKLLEERNEIIQKYLQLAPQAASQMAQGTSEFEQFQSWYNQLSQSATQSAIDIQNGFAMGSTAAIDKFLEDANWQLENIQHNIDLVNQQVSVYQDSGMYSAANSSISQLNGLYEQQSSILDTLIAKLKEMLAAAVAAGAIALGSDDYKKYEKIIMDWETKQSAAQATISSNRNKMQENARAILQARKNLEQTVRDEILKRKETEKEMLSSTVSLQNTILETIRERYREEAKLIEENLDKQKEALNEEKNILNKRLQMRKDALEQTDRLEEIDRLKQQLALISSDSSRTKEAKEIEKQIAKLTQEQTLASTEKEIEAETERIDDQIDAIDKKVEYDRERLEKYLEDANNFAALVDDVMSGTFEDMAGWLKENNKEWKNSLDDNQQQLLNTWKDTWESMKHILHTYDEEVQTILKSESTFLDYMKQSDSYNKDSSRGIQKGLESEWRKLFEDDTNANAPGKQVDTHNHYVANSGSSYTDLFAAIEELAGRTDFKMPEFTKIEDFDWVTAVVSGLTHNIPTSLDAMVSGANEAFGAFGDSFDTLQQGLVEAGEGGVKEAKGLFGKLITYASYERDAVVAAMDTLNDHADSASYQQLETLRDKYNNYINIVTEAQNADSASLNMTLDTVQASSADMFDAQRNTAEELKTSITEIEGEMSDDAKYKFGVMMEAAGTASSGIDNFVDQSMENVANGMAGMEQATQEAQANVKEGMNNFADDVDNSADTFRTQVDNSANLFRAQVDSIAQWLRIDTGTIASSLTGDMSEMKTKILTDVGNIKDYIEKNLVSSKLPTEPDYNNIGSTKTVEEQIADIAAEYSTIGSQYNPIDSGSGSSGSGNGSGSGSGGGSGSGSGGSRKKVYYVMSDGVIHEADSWNDVPRVALMGSETRSQVESYAKEMEQQYIAAQKEAARKAEEEEAARKAAEEEKKRKQQLQNYIKNNFTPNTYDNWYYSAKGTLGLAKAHGTLMGELGPELYVQNGHYGVAGQHGPEFVDLAKDAIVFNHLQTESLLKNGMSPTRGKAVTNEKVAAAYATGSYDVTALRSMLNAFDYAPVVPYMSHIDDTHSDSPTVNVGDININLYEAKLENDADYNKIAKKVGKIFTDEVKKNGLNLAGYAW